MTTALAPVPAVEPVDRSAEQHLLGSLLTIGKLGPVVAETRLAPEQFHYTRHADIYRAMLALRDREVPCDLITVADELQKRGKLDEAGGRAYLSELELASAGRELQAISYAKIVTEKAKWRERMQAGQAIREASLAEDEEAYTSAAEKLAEGHTPPDVFYDEDRQRDLVFELMQGQAAAEFEWPIAKLNTLQSGGMRRGQMIVLAAATNEGKALALDTPIPTPDGWTTMGEVQPGDYIFDDQGRPTRVMQATVVMEDRPCFEVVFSDGCRIVADADHQWVTTSHRERKRGPRVRRTAEIAETVARLDGRSNHSVEMPGPLRLREAVLPVDPYTLGAWLGDGSRGNSYITCYDPEIIARIKGAGYTITEPPSGRNLFGVRGLKVSLRKLGVLTEKAIPPVYKRASVDQRLALLQGLMDTDGTCSAAGQCEFTSTCAALALDVRDLAWGLGIKASMTVGRATLYGRDTGPKFRLRFRTVVPVFHLQRKLERLPTVLKCPTRFIREVNPVESVPVRCIEVDAPSHQFLAGEGYIPTHNSNFAAQILDTNRANGRRVCLYDNEMGVHEQAARRVTRQTGVPFGALMDGKLTEGQSRTVMDFLNRGSLWPIVDCAGWTATEICHHIRHHRWDLVVFDILHNLVYSDERELAAAVAQLKATAKIANCCIVVVAHVSRAGVERGKRRRPVRSDLKWSGDIENLADAVCFLYRKQDETTLEPTPEGYVYFDKVRGGRLGAEYVRFNGMSLQWELRAPDGDA